MNLKDRPKSPLTPFAGQAANAIAIEWFPMTPEQIIGPDRHRWMSEARAAFCLILHNNRIPSEHIAGFTGRSISAVNYSIRAARSLVATDTDYRDRIEVVLHKLSALRPT